MKALDTGMVLNMVQEGNAPIKHLNRRKIASRGAWWCDGFIATDTGKVPVRKNKWDNVEMSDGGYTRIMNICSAVCEDTEVFITGLLRLGSTGTCPDEWVTVFEFTDNRGNKNLIGGSLILSGLKGAGAKKAKFYFVEVEEVLQFLVAVYPNGGKVIFAPTLYTQEYFEKHEIMVEIKAVQNG